MTSHEGPEQHGTDGYYGSPDPYAVGQQPAPYGGQPPYPGSPGGPYPAPYGAQPPYAGSAAVPYGQPAYQPAPPPGAVPYGQPPYGYPYVPPRRTNGFAIASMVLGILWLYWIGSILALVFGYIARNQIRERGDAGNGMAIAGIVLGWVGVGVIAIAVVVGIVASS